MIRAFMSSGAFRAGLHMGVYHCWLWSKGACAVGRAGACAVGRAGACKNQMHPTVLLTNLC